MVTVLPMQLDAAAIESTQRAYQQMLGSLLHSAVGRWLGELGQCPGGGALHDRIGVGQRTAERRRGGSIATVSEDDGRVAQESRAARPPECRAPKALAKGGGVQREQRLRLQVGRARERGLSCRRRLAVPRADFLASVATE